MTGVAHVVTSEIESGVESIESGTRSEAGSGAGSLAGSGAGSGIKSAAGALPLVGHAHPLLRDPLAFLCSQGGEGPVVRLLIGRREAFLVTGTEAALQVLASEQRCFDKGGPFMEAARLLVGNGVITCSADEHRLQRPMAQPAFHRTRVAGYAPVMSACVRETTALWRPGRAVAVRDEMYRLSAAVVSRTLVSAPAGRQAAETMAATLPVLLQGMLRRMLVPLPWAHRVPTQANRRFSQARSRLDAAVDDVIAQYRGAERDRGDLLSTIMAAEEGSGRVPDDGEVRDQVMSVLAAGVETTASLLAWTFHVLARHPEAERRLWAELDARLSGREPAFDDLPHLPFTKRVLTEVLRLYPPAWMLSRVVVKPARVAGVVLPAGADVIVSPYALQRDPDVFPRPDVFEPDRWLPDRVTPGQRQSFLAFGAGRRRCMGEFYGMTEAMLALAGIGSRWRLRSLDPEPVRPVPRFLLMPSAQSLVLEERPGTC